MSDFAELALSNLRARVESQTEGLDLRQRSLLVRMSEMVARQRLKDLRKEGRVTPEQIIEALDELASSLVHGLARLKVEDN